eukprot:m.98270 g.98270  ORF g.98270 m.98270 type:complete len:460 (-) comp27047_c0_seq1:501-1880(-)
MATSESTRPQSSWNDEGFDDEDELDADLYVKGGKRCSNETASGTTVVLERMPSMDHSGADSDVVNNTPKLQEAEVAAFDEQFRLDPAAVLSSQSFRAVSTSPKKKKSSWFGTRRTPTSPSPTPTSPTSPSPTPTSPKSPMSTGSQSSFEGMRSIISKGSYSSNYMGKHDKKTFIARGKFSQVYRCNRKSDCKEVAVKVVDKRRITKKQLQEISQEAAVCRMIESTSCEYVVQLIDYYPERKKNFFVFEMMSGGELFDEIISREEGISESEASTWFKQLLLAVKACHSIDIIHRDLKLENLLLTKDKVLKLGDFGLAALVDNDSKCTGVVGSPIYVAPEVIKEEPYGKAIDMWSCGVILYVILSGTMPFQGDNNDEIFAKIKSGVVAFPTEDFSGVSEQAIALIKLMLQLNPDERITAEDALQHQWLSGKAPKLRRKGSVMSMKRQRNSIRPKSEYIPKF